ncbi:MarR family winged helix-turn-helix transcriptional regulator [Fervidibacillus halotolerans]|uniref:MarR family transcriptional regulator n=1 Tax=Fervidibacillus halotolerans TaxID=2980027 RepID=A0A9E8LXS4_9BACI|nr:MarR family transcriptional regulator [Fervidibacillus halotolerans]WAA11637.1 MarR family transcriptional regulator [Fervidibacillus halotolerans]
MNTYIDRIHKAMHQLRKYIDSELQNRPITHHQFFILSTISREGACKLSYLAEKMGVTPSAITVMIDRLEKLHYLERIHDPNDRRVILVKLTEYGEKTLQHSRKERDEIVKRKISHLNEEEIKRLAELVEKVAYSTTDQDN